MLRTLDNVTYCTERNENSKYKFRFKLKLKIKQNCSALPVGCVMKIFFQVSLAKQKAYNFFGCNPIKNAFHINNT